MTRFAYIRRDGRCVLRADGHADFCPGRDIVCAGASALVCALAGALDQLAAAYPGHVAEDTGRVPAQETETHGSAAAGRCPGAVPGSGQQRKKET